VREKRSNDLIAGTWGDGAQYAVEITGIGKFFFEAERAVSDASLDPDELFARDAGSLRSEASVSRVDNASLEP
jgi:hypothetical protein